MADQVSPHVTSLHVDVSWFQQPYPPNVFLISDGGEHAIIDSGFGDDESFDKRIAALKEAGAEKLKYIIITHHHYDHSSGAHRLREATGAQIVVHADEETLLVNPNIATADVEMPDDDSEEAKKAREMAKKWMLEAAKAVPDVRVKDGDVLTIGSLHLRCVHAPGHTAGHLCSYLEEDDVLFAGDNVLGVGTAAIGPPPHGDMGEYVRSLKKMQGVNAGLLAPGHGPHRVHHRPQGPAHRGAPRGARGRLGRARRTRCRSPREPRSTWREGTAATAACRSAGSRRSPAAAPTAATAAAAGGCSWPLTSR
mgnify:CR=1 FL=1